MVMAYNNTYFNKELVQHNFPDRLEKSAVCVNLIHYLSCRPQLNPNSEIVQSFQELIPKVLLDGGESCTLEDLLPRRWQEAEGWETA